MEKDRSEDQDEEKETKTDSDGDSTRAEGEAKSKFSLRKAFTRFLFVTATGFVVYALIDPAKDVAKNMVWPEKIHLSSTESLTSGVPERFQFAMENRSSVASISSGTISFFCRRQQHPNQRSAQIHFPLFG